MLVIGIHYLFDAENLNYFHVHFSLWSKIEILDHM